MSHKPLHDQDNKDDNSGLDAGIILATTELYGYLPLHHELSMVLVCSITLMPPEYQLCTHKGSSCVFGAVCPEHACIQMHASPSSSQMCCTVQDSDVFRYNHNHDEPDAHNGCDS